MNKKIMWYLLAIVPFNGNTYTMYDAIRYNMETEPEMAQQAAPTLVQGAEQQQDELEQVVEEQAKNPQEEAEFVAPTAQRSSPQNLTKKTQNTAPSLRQRGVSATSSQKKTPSRPQKKDTQQSQRALQKAPVAAYDSSKNSIIPEFNEKEFTEQRTKAVVQLVQKGVAYLQSHPESEAMSAFSFNKEFIDGELYLFVYNQDGICLANGDDEYLIWQDMSTYKDIYGNYTVRVMIEKATQGGGWITYPWRNSTKVTYIQQVVKDGKTYVIGAGYYPDSKRDASVSLVRSAVELFRGTVKNNGNIEEVFGQLSYPLGNFVLGDLYLFALDFSGNIMAQGDRPGLIGQNSLEYRDAEGVYVNKEIIAALNQSSEGVWVEYQSKRARKIAYAEKVTDAKGKNYFIACGYYPDADRRMGVDLVRQAFQYMASHGKTQAANEINSKTSNAFRYGDISLMVLDMQGLVIAASSNPDYIGTNQWDTQDEDGKYIVRELAEKAKDGGGWVDFRQKNASFFVYVEPVKVGKELYMISAGLYPISKPESMQLLVKSATSLLNDETRNVAMGDISKENGRFVRGDMSVFVFDNKGICYSYEEDPKYIWRQMLNAKDDDGREFVKLFINTAKQGAGRVTYKERGKIKYAYVEPVEKEGMIYVVGSSFFK